MLKTLFQALYLEIKPFKSTLQSFVKKGKTLKSQLLKKPTIEFYETQGLSSPNGKPKLLFYDYSWNFFFSPANRRGELWIVCRILHIFTQISLNRVNLRTISEQ